VILFGWGGGKPKDFGAAVPVLCPNCHNQTTLHYVKATRWFRLYFIPLIPYSTKHLLLCPVCSRGMEMTKAQAQLAYEMVGHTSTFVNGGATQELYESQATAFWDFMKPAQPAIDAPPPGELEPPSPN
jgi:hypothetical protein